MASLPDGGQLTRRLALGAALVLLLDQHGVHDGNLLRASRAQHPDEQLLLDSKLRLEELELCTAAVERLHESSKPRHQSDCIRAVDECGIRIRHGLRLRLHLASLRLHLVGLRHLLAGLRLHLVGLHHLLIDSHARVELHFHSGRAKEHIACLLLARRPQRLRHVQGELRRLVHVANVLSELAHACIALTAAACVDVALLCNGQRNVTASKCYRRGRLVEPALQAAEGATRGNEGEFEATATHLHGRQVPVVLELDDVEHQARHPKRHLRLVLLEPERNLYVELHRDAAAARLESAAILA